MYVNITLANPNRAAMIFKGSGLDENCFIQNQMNV
jgi:hypothetical protein